MGPESWESDDEGEVVPQKLASVVNERRVTIFGVAAAAVGCARARNGVAHKPCAPEEPAAVHRGSREIGEGAKANAKPVGPVAPSLATEMVLYVELPAIGLAAQMNFRVRPSRQKQLFDGTVNFLEAFASHHEEDLISVDVDGSVRKLDHLRRRANAELDTWLARLKQADEWEVKANRAKTEMNRMRDAYYKELFHLREQVYQKAKAEKDGGDYQPTYALHFDPAEYTFEDEVSKMVRDKVNFIKQEYDNKLNEIEWKQAVRVQALTEQLRTSKMILSRKEQLFEKLLKRHGYDDEEGVNGCAPKSEGSPEKQGENAESQATNTGEQSEAALVEFRTFLGRRFGSLKEAKAQLCAKRPLGQSLGLTDFQALCQELGFGSANALPLFIQVSGGQASMTLGAIFDLQLQPAKSSSFNGMTKVASGGARQKANGRRCSAPMTSAGSEPTHKTRGSVFAAEDWAVGSGQSSRRTFNTGKKHAEGQDEAAELSEGQSSSSSWGSSQSSQAAESKSGPKGSGKPAGAAKGGAKGRLRRASTTIGGGGKRPEVPASVRFGVECRSPTADLRTCPRLCERGTDAMPMELAYAKVKQYSRAVQSQVDGRMLDKAMDFFDDVAENNWKLLAGIAHDGTQENEEEEAVVPRGTAESMAREIKATRLSLLGATRLSLLGALDLAVPPPSDSPRRRAIGSRGLPIIDFAAVAGTLASSGRAQPVSCRCGGAQRQAVPDVQDFSVQCVMTRVVMLSPLEHWFPSDEDPHEVQLQQLVEMARELHARLPTMRVRAEKLALEAKGSERERLLVEDLRNLALVPTDKSAAAPAPSVRLSEKKHTAFGGLDKKGTDLAAMLSRHGVATAGLPAEADVEGPRQTFGAASQAAETSRHTFSGAVQGSDQGRPAAKRRPLRAPPPLIAHPPALRPLAELDGIAVRHTTGAASSGEQEAEGSQPVRRTMALTVKPISPADSAQSSADRARRLPGVRREEGTTAKSEPEVSPPPGWSGLVPQPSFTFRGVPIESECAPGAPAGSVAHPLTPVSARPVRSMRQVNMNTISLEAGAAAASHRSSAPQSRPSRDTFGTLENERESFADGSVSHRLPRQQGPRTPCLRDSFGTEPPFDERESFADAGEQGTAGLEEADDEVLLQDRLAQGGGATQRGSAGEGHGRAALVEARAASRAAAQQNGTALPSIGRPGNEERRTLSGTQHISFPGEAGTALRICTGKGGTSPQTARLGAKQARPKELRTLERKKTQDLKQLAMSDWQSEDNASADHSSFGARPKYQRQVSASEREPPAEQRTSPTPAAGRVLRLGADVEPPAVAVQSMSSEDAAQAGAAASSGGITSRLPRNFRQVLALRKQ